MARRFARIIIGAAAFTGATWCGGAVAGASRPAIAGPPAVHACVGSTLSGLATSQSAPGEFGQSVRAFAQTADGQPGLGDGLQGLQAGVVPDSIVPNTCND